MKYILALNSFRPLRAVGRLRGTKALVTAVVNCLPTMMSVVILFICIMFWFSMVGVIMFSDTLHTRCLGEDSSWGSVCNERSSDATYQWLFPSCGSTGNCTNGAPTPSEWENYDHVGFASLAILQVITLDSWAQVAQEVMNGLSPFAALYYFVLSLIGTQYALNLLLAVITDAFAKMYEEERLELEERAQREGTNKGGVSAALQGNLDEELDSKGADNAENATETVTASALPPATTLKDDDEEQYDVVSRASSKKGSTSAKGTAPLAKRQWKEFRASLSRASASSLHTGVKSIDVSSCFASNPLEQAAENRDNEKEEAKKAEEAKGPARESAALCSDERLRYVSNWVNMIPTEPDVHDLEVPFAGC